VNSVYEIICPKILKIAKDVVDAKSTYLAELDKKAKGLEPWIDGIAYRSFGSSICVGGVSCRKGQEDKVDTKIWTPMRENNGISYFSPKRNSKKALAFRKELEITSSYKFHQTEVEKLLEWKSQARNGMLAIFGIGYIRDEKKGVFRAFINGYEGYKPNKKHLKEILPGEYRKLMEKNK